MSAQKNSKQKRISLLNFQAKIKRKRGTKIREPVNLFPKPGKVIFDGRFNGFCVEISDKEQMCKLHSCGGYGRGTQSRSAPQAMKGKARKRQQLAVNEEKLVLGLEESCFLAYVLNVLKICDMRGNEMQQEQFLAAAIRINAFYIECLAAYLYLKFRGWVVACGTKFGSHYVIYEKGPRFNHASFMVMVTKAGQEAAEIYQRTSLMGRQRVAEATGKDLLILEVNKPADFIADSMEAFKQIKITETIVRRFNYNKFSQS